MRASRSCQARTIGAQTGAPLVVWVLLSACNAYDSGLISGRGQAPAAALDASAGDPAAAGPESGVATADSGTPGVGAPQADASTSPPVGVFDPLTCSSGECWWSRDTDDDCRSAGVPSDADRPDDDADDTSDAGEIYLGWTKIRLGSTLPDGTEDDNAWQGFGLDLDGTCTNSVSCPAVQDVQSCKAATTRIPFDGELCRDNTFASLQPIVAEVPEIGQNLGIGEGLFNCELWHGSYNVVVRLTGYNGEPDDAHVRVDFYTSDGLEVPNAWQCPLTDYETSYPLWRSTETWHMDDSTLVGPVATPGSLPDSTNADPDAYVRDGYLVARVPDGTMLRLTGNAMPYRGFSLKLSAGYYIGHLQRGPDRVWSIRDGLVAGRIRTDDLILGFRQAGFCEGQGLDSFYDAMVTYVQEYADVLADGGTDTEVACDAMSMGLAFSASQITPGAAGPVEPLIECCPPGMSALQCTMVCGDGALTGDEQCDTAITGPVSGACPTGCAPLDSCTPQALVGSDCDAHCEPRPIVDPLDGDGCCPPGANSTDDDDCASVCGNAVIEPSGNETCDPIDTCPTDCTSSDACLLPVLSGSPQSCTATCDLVPVTACADGDGCCPEDCTQATDDDCSAACGDGFIDPTRETCEAGTATPCPASCDDGKPCTRNLRSGSSSNCNVVCSYPAITQPGDGDGCCPPGANANTDDDCPSVCGNGVLEDGERCDGSCPSACEDGIACTANMLVGVDCDRRCEFPPITQAADDDGCCVSGANANTDNDCPSVCGNGIIEPDEFCDDQNDVAGDGCANCQIETDEQICLAVLDPPDACETCSCKQCTDETVSCHASPNSTLNARCTALIDCGRANGCTGDACYCGTANPLSCLYGGANGPCRTQTEQAAQSTSPVEISNRKYNTNYALGRANVLADCAAGSCASACGL